MKKYMIVLFVLAVACAFSVSAVMAADLEKYDFDGKFTMEMKKGLDFKKQIPQEGSVAFIDLKSNVSVMYIEASEFSPSLSDKMNSQYEAQGYKAVATEGNLTVFEKDGLYLVPLCSDGIIVVSMAMDKDSALNPMKTIQFTK